MVASMIRDLAVAIICEARYPLTGSRVSLSVSTIYKGKGDALDRGNYRGLRLTEQVMKVLERIVDGLMRQVVSIDDSQFGFVPVRGTTISACTNGRFGRIYVRKFLSYAKNRHQRRPRTSKIISVCPDSKGMSYIPISFRLINSCQNMYIKCILNTRNITVEQ